MSDQFEGGCVCEAVRFAIAKVVGSQWPEHNLA